MVGGRGDHPKGGTEPQPRGGAKTSRQVHQHHSQAGHRLPGAPAEAQACVEHLINKNPITKEDVKVRPCTTQNLLHDMLAETAREYPALASVFVDERDIFLATDAIPAHALHTSGSSTTSTPRQCSCWHGGAPLPSRQGRRVHCEESCVGRLPVRSLQGVEGRRVQNTVSEINK